MTLLAAPKIVRFPAIVEPAASAIQDRVFDDENPTCCKTGIDIATNGTLLTNWLDRMLVPIMLTVELGEPRASNGKIV